jgi:hypothetical protein
MPLPEGLLAPISGDEPAGPDLSISNEYAEVDRAYRDADIPPALSPSGALEAPDTSFADVVELATDFLSSRSKDLKIAVLLTGALIREEGFSGFSSGLDLIRGLMDGFWDTLHPGVAGRAAVLNWLGSDAVAYALYLVPLTDSGHTYHHYKEWLKKASERRHGPGTMSSTPLWVAPQQRWRLWAHSVRRDSRNRTRGLRDTGIWRMPSSGSRPAPRICWAESPRRPPSVQRHPRSARREHPPRGPRPLARDRWLRRPSWPSREIRQKPPSPWRRRRVSSAAPNRTTRLPTFSSAASAGGSCEPRANTRTRES